jgi:hypothetical protein
VVSSICCDWYFSEPRLALSRTVVTVPRSGTDGEVRIGDWIERPDGTLIQFSTIPAGMTVAEAERIVSQPG